MALYDNKYWLLSHIRNSFISTDDTGMCEVVMSGEHKFVKTLLPTYSDSDSTEEEDLNHESYDVELDMNFCIRERSNTAARLEKVEQQMKKAAKIKNVKWENPKTPLSKDEVDDLFVKKDLTRNEGINTTKTSLLSKLLEDFTNLPLNPYIEYAKYDGTEQFNISTRKYKIFLTMLPEEQRNYPIDICCIATAKIVDLIGLILLKCSLNHGDFPLKPVSNYGLFITEEDGEVDRDFPCLDPKEGVAKFGFNYLSLVEHKDPVKCVSFEENTNEDTAKKKDKQDVKHDDTRQIKNDMALMHVHNKAMEAPLYQSYRVFIVSKVRPKIEILLGISGEKIEIDPVAQKNSKFTLVKQKAVSHHMDTVAFCQIIDTKGNRSTFRVVYSLSFGTHSSEANFSGTSQGFQPLQSSASFKHYDFEADTATAEDIVLKINLILDLMSSASRKEYLAGKERKNVKRKSFNLGKSK